MARGSSLFHTYLVGCCMALPIHSAPVSASDDTESSQDAFGSRVGVESLGVYSESQVVSP